MNKRVVWCAIGGLLLVAALAFALDAVNNSPARHQTAASVPATPLSSGTSLSSGSIASQAGQPIITPYLKDAKPSQTQNAVVPVEFSRVGSLEKSKAPRDLSRATRIESTDAIEMPIETGDHGSPGSLDAYCRINKFAGTSVSYWSGWQIGDAFLNWYDPTRCGTSPYPFRIDTLAWTIRTSAIDTLYFTYSVICPRIPGDSCSGPGEVIYEYSAYILFPSVAAYNIPIPIPVAERPVVSGGFYLGLTLDYWGGTTAQFVPGPRWGNVAITNCSQFYWDGVCAVDWVDFGFATAGHFQAYVAGNTNDAGTPVTCPTINPCVVDCQVGDILETAEPAVPDSANMEADPNGGCNAVPVDFDSIACGAWVCGKFFNYYTPSFDVYRDTDWYLFTITEQDTVRLTVITESPALIGIVDTNSCVSPSFLVSTFTENCTTSITSPCLEPGTYGVFISSASFNCPIFPDTAQYRANIVCGSCTIEECTPDYTMTAPGTWNSTTCGAGDDCTLRSGEDLIVQVTIPATGYYTISLCSGATNWDTYITLTDACCGGTIVAFSDDGCTSGVLSEIACRSYTAGTYYLDIEAWDITQQDPDCGPIALVIEACEPCTPLPPNDDCPNAIPITVNAPDPTCATNNCATVDCNQNSFHEVWYVFTLTDTCQNVRVRYCGTTISGSLGVSIFTDSCCGTRVSYDSYEYTSCPDGFITIHYDSLAAGTYWLPVNFSVYGNYCVRVTSTPCVPCVSCPSGGIAENEPDCEPGYLDVTNGGCNGSPARFTSIACGQTVCATAGTFDADTMRDTDWYSFTLTQESWVKLTVLSMFRTTALIYDSSDCEDLELMVQDTANACDTLRLISALLQPGTYWAVVAPMFSGGHVECGTPYWVSLECNPCGGVVQLPTDLVECAETPGPTHGDNDCSGGCNNDPNPHLYNQIACGQTVFGTSFTYNPTDSTNSRDTDWHHLVLADSQYVTLTVESDFVGYVFFMRYEDCTNFETFMQFGIPQPCTPVTRTTTTKMAPGEYTVWVGPGDYFGVPYPSYYRVTVGCPCAPALKTTVYMNSTNTGVTVRWVAQSAGTYRVYSTTDKNIAFDPGTWTTETTVSIPAGNGSWTDPSGIVSYKRYVVQQICE